MKANDVHFANPVRISAADLLALTTELIALTAVTSWGAHHGSWPAALGAATAFTAAWGMYLSPQAPRPVTVPAWPLAKLVVFSLSALALASDSGPLLAAPFLTAALLSVILGGTR